MSEIIGHIPRDPYYHENGGEIVYVSMSYYHEFSLDFGVEDSALWLTIPQARALCDALARKLAALAEDAELPEVREKSTSVENADEYENVPFGDADTARWRRGIFL